MATMISSIRGASEAGALASKGLTYIGRDGTRYRAQASRLQGSRGISEAIAKAEARGADETTLATLRAAMAYYVILRNECWEAETGDGPVGAWGAPWWGRASWHFASPRVIGIQRDDTMNDETTTVAADETTSEAPVETTSEATATADAPAVKSKRDRKAERKAKAKAAAKKGGKAKGDKPAVAPTVRDAYGNRLGTSSAAINATILKAGVPLTVKEIHERTGADGRATEGATRGHIMWLLARGHVKLKDGGYVKASKKPRKAKGDDKPAADESESETAGE